LRIMRRALRNADRNIESFYMRDAQNFDF